MEADVLWSSVLTAAVGFMVWHMKTQHDELKRVTILLNKTREEYVSKADYNTAIDRMIDRLDALDAKLDRIFERKDT